MLDNVSVLTILARCTFSICWEDLNNRLHRKLCEAVIAALHERTAPTVFPKTKAHSGQFLNEQEDAEAEKGTRLDKPVKIWASSETYTEAPTTATTLINSTDKLTLNTAVQHRIRIPTQDRKERLMKKSSKMGHKITHSLRDRKVGRYNGAELMRTCQKAAPPAIEILGQQFLFLCCLHA